MDPAILRKFRRQLRQLEREILSQLQQDTVCCGVSVAQCHALLEIEDRGPTTLTGLAAALGLDKSTLSRTIDGLVEAGWVERAVDPSSRRAIRISLTAAGQSVCDRINREVNGFYLNLFGRIPPKKQAWVLEGVSLLIEAFRQAAAEGAGRVSCCRAPASAAGTGVKRHD